MEFKSPEDFEQLKISSFKQWTLYLHPNQYYLGRTYVALNREGDKDLSDMDRYESAEFLRISQSLKRTLINLFQTDKLNFSQLGNEWHHLHVHVVPRYASPRTFDGIEFRDERWGKNYAPYPKDFQIPDSTLFNIRDAIRGRLVGTSI